MTKFSVSSVAHCPLFKRHLRTGNLRTVRVDAMQGTRGVFLTPRGHRGTENTRQDQFEDNDPFTQRIIGCARRSSHDRPRMEGRMGLSANSLVSHELGFLRARFAAACTRATRRAPCRGHAAHQGIAHPSIPRSARYDRKRRPGPVGKASVEHAGRAARPGSAPAQRAGLTTTSRRHSGAAPATARGCRW
jgi:hypothetical protein